MIEPSPKPSKSRRFSGNHQRSWLWGHHAVCETLLAGKWPVLAIYANQTGFDQASDLLLAKHRAGVSLEIVDSSRLEQLSRSTEHQGLVIRLGEFPYPSLASFVEVVKHAVATSVDNNGATANSLRPLVVICDRIQDTFNFGAILRCCDAASVLGVIVGEPCQAEVTPQVARSSSGAVNHVNIVKVDDLLRAARTVKALGLQLVAADANTPTPVWHSPLNSPTALVIGSEATGIQPDLLAICDQRLWIPMHGQVTSLNAAVATGVMLYEIRRQQLNH